MFFMEKKILFGNIQPNTDDDQLEKPADVQEVTEKNKQEAKPGDNIAEFSDWDIMPPDTFINPRIKP